MESELAELVELAKKLRKYREYTSVAFAFLIFATIYASVTLILISVSIALNLSSPLYLAIAFLLYVVCGIVGMYILLSVVIVEPREGREWWKWVVAFTLPFFVLYAIPTPSIPKNVAWLVALGIALGLVYVLMERRRCRTKFFLLSSVLILVLSPLAIALEHMKVGMGGLAATGFMLLAYFITSVYALYLAKKTLEEGSGSVSTL